MAYKSKMAAPCQQFSVAIFALSVILTSVLTADEESMVPNYTKDDFDTNLERGPHFVLFYAPWCGHCKKTFPAWEALGRRFNSDDTREATIAKVDCTVETSLCSTHNIMGYPTMKFFHEGQGSVEVYKGQRDVDSFEAFVIREVKEREDLMTSEEPPSSDGGLYELTSQTFPAHTEQGDHFVKFYAPWCAHCQRLAPTWAQLAETYEKDQSLSIAKVDCVKERELCQKYSIKAYPTMLWFRNGDQFDQYKGSRDLDSLLEYIEQTTAQVDQSAQSDADKVPDFPIPSEDIVKGSVISLDDGNFDAIMSRYNTVLIKFFVNWCGHCQALVPVYKELAQSFEDDENIAIAEVDCIENRQTLCDKFDVQGYPTLLLFRNGQQIDEYSGPRDLEHLTSYLSEHVPHDEL